MRTDVNPPSAAITVGDLLLAAAGEAPESDALVFPEETLNFAAFAKRAQALARACLAHGIRAGDRVGILMPNSTDCAAALFGIALAGAVAVPTNIRYRAVEVP